jgi:hypothetical protein
MVMVCSQIAATFGDLLRTSQSDSTATKRSIADMSRKFTQYEIDMGKLIDGLIGTPMTSSSTPSPASTRSSRSSNSSGSTDDIESVGSHSSNNSIDGEMNSSEGTSTMLSPLSLFSPNASKLATLLELTRGQLAHSVDITTTPTRSRKVCLLSTCMHA